MDEAMIDRHILDSAHDLFGFGDFGRALGRAIVETRNPEGTVIGLSGPWGSGKTSIIETYVVPALGAAKVEIVRFDPWAVIEGRDLLLEFLSSLQGALPKEIARRVTSTLTAIARLAVPIVRDTATAIVTTAGATSGLPGLAVAAGASKTITKASDWVSRLLSDKPLGQRLAELREGLAGNDQRIVFIIDDLDRLQTDELLLVFRMLRTVGRLHNVVHLLAIDRNVAERVVSERFPSEGPTYLDKIVQTWFEVPTPHVAALSQAVLGGLCKLAELNERESSNLENDAAFTHAVLPLLETPRDLKRLLGALELVWPALAGDVHIGDLAALEAIKLRHVETYRAIRRNEAWLYHPTDLRSLGELPTVEDINRVFRLPDELEAGERVRRALAALFPNEIGKTYEGAVPTARADDDRDFKDRRLRSPEHFAAYFRLAGSADTLRIGERKELLEALGDPKRLRDILLRAVKTPSPTGRTRAAAYIYEIMVNVDAVSTKFAPSFVRALFSVADDIDVAADDSDFPGVSLTRERLLQTVSALRRHHGPNLVADWIENAIPESGPFWALRIAHLCQKDHDPQAETKGGPIVSPLVPEERLSRITVAALERFERGVADGSVGRTPRHLAAGLYAWARLKQDDARAARELTERLLASDEGVITLADAFTGVVVHGNTSGNTWRLPKLHRSRDVHILDWDRLRSRIEDLLASADLTYERKRILERCKEAFDRDDKGEDS
jgi:hypothetical protein